MPDLIKNHGSTWNKWDLHIHTPSSIYQNYGGDQDVSWKKFISDLEALPSHIKAIGINDYFFIDGYRRVQEYRRTGRLTNLELILPVVELRIDRLAGSGDSVLKKINFHVIFSDKLTPDEIQRFFLDAIQHSFILDPDSEVEDSEFNTIITRDTLIELGELIKSKSSRHSDTSSIRVGFNNLVTEYTKIKEVLKSKQLKDKFLLAVGKTEWDAMRWESAAGLKKDIINSVDFVFIALEQPEHYQRHLEALKANHVNSKLLDCSDAHNFSSSSEKDRIGNCFTWLKCDRTFSGLRQVAKEPSRIFVGDAPPLFARVKQNRNYYIKKLSFKKVGSATDERWFDGIEIDLNPALVAIIGNKGNGKSALADTLGVLGNTRQYDFFSFLNELKFRKKRPLNKSECFQGQLTWDDDSIEERRLSDDPEQNSVEKVKYLPQGFLEKLCNDDLDIFEKELRKVIFSHIKDEDKLGQGNLDDLIRFRAEAIDVEISSIKEEVEQLNDKIISLETRDSQTYRSSIDERLRVRRDTLAKHELSKPIWESTEDTLQQTALTKEIEEERVRLETSQATYESNLQIQKSLKISITELEKVIRIVKSYVSDLHGRYRDELKGILYKYEIEVDIILKVIIDEAPIEKLIKDLSAQLGRVDATIQQSEIENRLLEERIKNLQGQLDEPAKKFQKYLDESIAWENVKRQIEGHEKIEGSLKYLENEKKYLAESLVQDLNALKLQRKALLKKMVERKGEIIALYKKFFEPLTAFIATYKELLDTFEIKLDVEYKLSGFQEKFFDHISQGVKGSFYSHPAGTLRLASILQSSDIKTEDGILSFLDTIMENLQSDFRLDERPPREIASQLKTGYSVKDLYKFLFSLDYLEPFYRLKLADKDLTDLSPGERGALLLIFYLSFDRDQIPLIIDQPEENLDNQSVYNILVRFIKLAKERRQVILVTHNPNLAVVCDAEQIIHVNIDKTNKNTVEVKSGAIENPETIESVVDVLEGTYPAFDVRSVVYKTHRVPRGRKRI